MQAQSRRKRFFLIDFASQGKPSVRSATFNKCNSALACLCGKPDHRKLSCYKCKTSVHACLECKPNRDIFYECAPCISRNMDPLVKIKKVLAQSYFKVQSIFEFCNEVRFQFNLTPEDLLYPVEIRGLKPSNITLSYPMSGCFIINDQKASFFDLRPLMTNSNRKIRKDQYICIPQQSLKSGRNVLTFIIYKIDREKFVSRFQFEQRGLYYLSVNLVEKITSEELINQTIRERRMEKKDSLKFLNETYGDIEITKNRLTLACPYTKDRIKIPVRGRQCRHYSCVCLQTLIACHSINRLWTCPLCDNRINQPYVDVFIYTILKDNNHKGDEVMIATDGKYQWVSKKDTAINLDDDDDNAHQDDREYETNQEEASSTKPQENFINELLNKPQNEPPQKEKKKQTLELIKSKLKIMAHTLPKLQNKLQSSIKNPLVINQITRLKSIPKIVEIKSIKLIPMTAQQFRSKKYITRTPITYQHITFIKSKTEFKKLFSQLIK